MILFVVLTTIAILIQFYVAYNSYILYKLIRPLKMWSVGWGLFGISMMLVAFRRIWALYLFSKETEWLTGGCPKDIWSRILETIILLIISILWVIFVSSMKKIFVKYLGPHSGDEVLVHRESVVEQRETTALAREDVVGKREVAVQNREDKQKQSPYYEDADKLLRKIVNGK